VIPLEISIDFCAVNDRNGKNFYSENHVKQQTQPFVIVEFQQKNKEKLNEGIITPKQFWTREAAMYYGLNPIWWSLVLLAVVNTKGGLDNKLKLGVALIGAGAVVGVLAKNIQEEEKLKKNSILNKKS
jgi:hypothetical protein